jgi:hypothetical protein
VMQKSESCVSGMARNRAKEVRFPAFRAEATHGNPGGSHARRKVALLGELRKGAVEDLDGARCLSLR